MIAGPSRVPAPDGMRVDDAPLMVLPEGASLKGMKLSYLAAGGMSVAYRGVRPDGKKVFVKEVSKSQSQSVVSLTQEKALLERLLHPSIPRLQDFCEWRDHLYLIQDFIDGTNLEQQISPFPDIFLPEAKVRDWGLQLCDILHYLHQQTPPIIYRDLKPKNVLLHPSGRLYLVDFGIARAYKEGKDQDTRLLGSVLTASPEHYGGQTDVRSDLYTLGATLHYLLTNGQGERLSPFDFPPISAMRRDVSGELQSVIEKCLQRDPEQRFASVQELRRALQGEVTDEAGVPSLPLEKVRSEPAAPRRGLPAWAQIGLGLALGWVLNGLYKRVGASPQDLTPSPTPKVMIAAATPSPMPTALEPTKSPVLPVEQPDRPRPLPTDARPGPAVVVTRPSPAATAAVVVPPKPRPSPARPRLEPGGPAYPQRVPPPSQGGEALAEALLEELGLPWDQIQNLPSSEGGAQSVTRATGPDGIFSMDVPEGFRYLGNPQDFSLLRWQRRNFEVIRLKTVMGRSCSLSELSEARQRQFSGLGQPKTINLQLQGRNLQALVIQLPNRRFKVVEVLWSQTQPDFTLSISGGAGVARFPAYLAEFQAYLNRCRL